MSNARRNGAIVGLVICTLAWAGNALVARATAGMLPPIGLSFWRWLTALLLLLPFTLPSLYRHRDLLSVHWKQIAILAALSISSYNTLLYLAAQSTTAINITLVNTGLPVAAFIWSVVLLRQGCEESVDGLPPVWFAPSLDSLLKRPQEKAALWTLLRRVRSRWQEKS